MLKAGIIGLGVGERHIAGYQAHPQCEVAAICDFSDGRRASVAARHPKIRLVANADEILDDPAIQVVSICSYDNHHHDQIVKALTRGKHVFVEKPLCLHEDEARHIRSLLEKSPHLRLSSNLILRRYPRFVDLKSRLAAGRLGRLFHIEGDYNYGRLEKITSGWRGTMDDYSVVLGGGIHLIDLLLWLTGDRVIEVAAFGNRISSEGTQFRYQDMVVAVLKFQSGLVGKVSANFGCVFPHFHRLSAYGTEGTFVNELDAGRYYSSRDSKAKPEVSSTPYPGVDKGDMIASFVDSILHGTRSEVTETEIFECMAICFAIERALKDGAVTPVRPL